MEGRRRGKEGRGKGGWKGRRGSSHAFCWGNLGSPEFLLNKFGEDILNQG